jgi:ribosomal protein S18 acetylase RimI-like enzyme
MFAPEQLRSLGGRTDLAIFAGLGTRFEPREGYFVGATPGNPGFFYGNFLCFPGPPQPGDLPHWESLFRHEFRLAPDVRHFTFLWDEGGEGELAPFRAAGYTYDPGSVHTLGELVLPTRAYAGLEVRALAGDGDWEAMIANQVACRSEGFELEPYLRFKRRQAASYRAMAERGQGAWWGGFVHGRLVADCGLYEFGEVGRFQNVGTHPDFRRRGICAALVHEVSRRAIERDPRRTLVMVAGSGEPAERVYRSVGFVLREQTYALWKPPAP